MARQARHNNWNLARRNWDLAANPRFGLSKHHAKYVGKYLKKYLQPRSRLRRHLRLSLHFDLNLDLNLDLNPSLHRALLAEFYPQLLKSFLATIFGSMFAAKHLWLQVQMRLASCRQVRPLRQSVGRPLHGRIVVRPRPTTTYR